MLKYLLQKMLLSVLILAFTYSKSDAQIAFTKHLIDNNLGFAFTVYSADVDKNGAVDILSGGQAGEFVLYKNNGNGSFSNQTISNSFGNVWSVCAIDIDSDSDIDLLGASYSRDEIAWWENSGGSFTKHTISSNFDGAEAVRAADMDRDGDVDIVGGAVEGNELAWWENRGGGSFTKHNIETDLNRPHYLCLADLDRDNDIDIAVASASDMSIAWWRNNGSGSFSRVVVDRNFTGAYCIEAFDIDKDGDMDLLGAAHSINQIAWWKNNGSGSFTKYIITNSFTETHSAFAGDMDQDGDIDIAGVSRGLNEVAWWKNNGSQSFTKYSIATNIVQPQTVSLADLDKDGDLDVISQSRSADDVYWWENENTAESISRPDQPNGPETGIVGENLTYSTGGSTSSFGHNVEYRFDWGDGELSSWGGATRSYLYNSNGSYEIKAQARCETHTSIVSNWSIGLPVTIATETVSTPFQQTGPTTGVVGQILNYSTGGSVSNYGHSVEYQFEWGDGLLSNWGSSSQNHAFSSTGTFNLRAHARCQQHTTIISNWSTTLSVVISPNVFNVSGLVSYYSNQMPVANVLLNATGDVSKQDTTFSDGAYNFSIEAGKNFVITPSKTKKEDVHYFDITTYDAALTARHALGLDLLTANQQIAADVDKSGQILTYDSALLACYAVGLPTAPNTYIGEWLFIPQSKSFVNINVNKLAENFSAIIIGNVHGGWNPQALLNKDGNHIGGQEDFVHIEKLVNKVLITLKIESGMNVISSDIEAVYDHSVYEFCEFKTTGLSDKFNVVYNDEPGKLRISMYAINPVNDAGDFLKLKFLPKQPENFDCLISINKYLVNDVLVAQELTEVSNANESNKIDSYQLFQNFPNPFNSSTIIRWQAVEPGFATLKIFNLSGQEIKSLLKSRIDSGSHQIFWDGTNNEGKKVSGGIYIYQLTINNYKESKKLLLVQ